MRIINSDIGHKIAALQDRVRYCLKRIESNCKVNADRNAILLDKAVNRLSTLNPTSVLKRGYGYVSNDNGVVRSATQLNVGDEFRLTLQDGSISAKVTEKENKR